MGCPCELRFHSDTEQAFARAAERCLREIRRFEKKYSRYVPQSITSRINRAAGRTPVSIDAETAAILKYAAVCHDQSNGLFDMTAGVLRRVWHRQRTTLPRPDELEVFLVLVGWDRVEFSGKQVFLPLKGMELDFGGVVKEYAADAAAMFARKAGIRHGLINLGGDICLVGPQPGGTAWPIGIVHPLQTGSAIATVPLLDGALTTSGGYERYIEIDGKRFSHLIDPRSGWPVESLLSVSVAAEQAIVAGSIATIALLQLPVAGLEWLESCGAPYLAVDVDMKCYGHLAARQL